MIQNIIGSILLFAMSVMAFIGVLSGASHQYVILGLSAFVTVALVFDKQEGKSIASMIRKRLKG